MREPTQEAVIAGKYVLERELGRGGMGSVWIALDTKLDRRVAVKFMSPDHAQSPESWARFEREARAAAMVNSPYVVQIHDFGSDDGTPYIVMELLQGEDVEARLAARGRLSLPEAASLLSSTAKALEVVHAAGIIHRDLKPSNIFLAQQGGEEIVKLLDFGIAKAPRRPGEAEASTARSIIGTVHYMSPEQAQGRPLNYQSDLWSLGVIMFRAVTGALPFHADEPMEVLVQICTAPIPLATAVAPDLPPMIESFFQRALQRDPASRFLSAMEMADAFGHLIGASGVEGASWGGSGARVEPTVRLPDAPISPERASPLPPALVMTPPVGAAIDKPSSPWANAPPPLRDEPAPPVDALAPSKAEGASRDQAVVAPRPAPSQSSPSAGGSYPKSLWWVAGAGAAFFIGATVAVVVGMDTCSHTDIDAGVDAASETGDHNEGTGDDAQVDAHLQTDDHKEGPSDDELSRAPESNVLGSSALGCSTRIAQGWLRVQCSGGSAGTPQGIDIVTGQQPAMRTTQSGGALSFYMPLAPGAYVEASFSFTDRARKLILDWPEGAAQPSWIGVFDSGFRSISWNPGQATCPGEEPAVLVGGRGGECHDLQWLTSELRRLRAAKVAGLRDLPAGFELRTVDTERGAYWFLYIVDPSTGRNLRALQFKSGALVVNDAQGSTALAALSLDDKQYWWVAQERDQKRHYSPIGR